MTNFQRRALTATVFAAVMLVGLFWNELSFTALFLVISIGCQWEFLKLTVEKSVIRYGLALLIGIAVFAINSFFLETIKHYFLVLFPLILLTPIAELFLKSEKPFQNMALIFFSLFYPCLSVAFSVSNDLTIWHEGFTPNIVFGILLLTWANDSFAYIIGSRIGKTPLFPRISPKKTWEGTIGGAIMCILTGLGIYYFLGILSLTDWLVIGGIVAVFGTLGDLIESMLKRSVGVKDSGSFMPGHGGFLDRFDAFIFALPFVYLYLLVAR
ncbi:MAG: phosphatidate cytidylyltransferase [Saprospiraceae bacterium]|nr:phosphatidate cytidylyltransferase [Saprospiraceae bacterium]